MGDKNEKTRYVMVDWKMVETNGRSGNVKFFAPTVFDKNVSAKDFVSYLYYGQNYQQRLVVNKQAYYNSTMVRLYKYDGSAVDAKPIVVDWDTTQDGYKIAPQGPNETVVRKFDTMKQARAFVQKDGSSQIGCIGPYPSKSIPASYTTVSSRRASPSTSVRTIRYSANVSDS